MPLLAQINANYRLSSDDHNVIVEERRVVTPKDGGELYEKWFEIAYFPRLEFACEYVLDRIVRKSDARSIEELKAVITDAKREIIESIRKGTFTKRK